MGQHLDNINNQRKEFVVKISDHILLADTVFTETVYPHRPFLDKLLRMDGTK